MSTGTKWWRFFPLPILAIAVAAIPTRVSDHDVAVGFPFTWHSRQEVITLGEQPHSSSAPLLMLDIAIALIILSAISFDLVRLLRKMKVKRS